MKIDRVKKEESDFFPYLVEHHVNIRRIAGRIWCAQGKVPHRAAKEEQKIWARFQQLRGHIKDIVLIL